MHRVKKIAVLVCIFFVCTALEPQAATLPPEGFEAYLNGDYSTAIEICKPLAEQGDMTSQYSLGWMYEEGQGVPQDYKEAVKWYSKSAEQGGTHAQTALGIIYAKGLGVLQDYVQAYAWWNIASSQGNEIAKKNRKFALEKMSPDQIAKGQELSKQLYKKIYGDIKGGKEQK